MSQLDKENLYILLPFNVFESFMLNKTAFILSKIQ